MCPARFLPARLKHVLRRLLAAGGANPHPPALRQAAAFRDYPQWLAQQIAERAQAYLPPARAVTFSVLTTVYEKTDAALLREAAASLRAQSLAFHEWVLLAHGPVQPELDTLLEVLGAEVRVKVHRLPENLGIVGGMRHCLEAATGEYVVAMDADDLLTPDALQILASTIATQGAPAILYSDEDILVGDALQNPYLRPDWDPVLNLANSYVWHLCAFRRDLALQLDVYGDAALNWCHDWDTVTHFANAGHIPCHVREVLYHWRQHEGSTTNRSGPNQGSLDSTRYLLERQVARNPHPERYRLAYFPVSRGTPEWHISRRHVDPEPLDLVLMVRDADHALLTLGAMEKHLGYRPASVTLCLPPETPRSARVVLEQYARALLPKTAPRDSVSGVETPGVSALRAALRRGTAPLVWLCSDAVRLADGEAPWEALRLIELHPDVGIACGKLVGGDGRIADAGGTLSRAGEILCPMRGSADVDAGPYALRLKPHSVDAPCADLMIARRTLLEAACDGMPSAVTPQGLALWLAGAALEAGARVAFSPLIRADSQGSPLAVMGTVSERERDAFLSRYGSMFRDVKYSESRYLDLQ